MLYARSVPPSEPGGQDELSFEIRSRLLRERIVLIGSRLDEPAASLVIAQILHLEAENPDGPISLHINSPEGSADPGLAVHDVIQSVRPPISTTCIGAAMGIASLLLAAGSPGRRAAIPNARIRIQHAAATLGGNSIDIATQAEEIVGVRRRVEELLAQHTRQPIELIHSDIERTRAFTAQEAIDYGLIDRIVERR
jgi:ATP-dependent Clp protease protease subunit